MSTHTITAMFDTRQQAEQAAQKLVTELQVERSAIRLSPETAGTEIESGRAPVDRGFFESLREMFLPEEDRHVYAEGVRRGGVMLSLSVDDEQAERAADILERAGAVNLDEQEASWRQSGWVGHESDEQAPMTPAGALGTSPEVRGTTPMAETGTTAGGDTLKVVEERLVVGKRDRDTGRVRVRSYVVERPVEEQVTLHEERIDVERRKVDRVATAADMGAFEERTIEARAHSEEALISKEARVVEEIALRKESSDRTQTVRDTVRETKVEVEDDTKPGGGGDRLAGRNVPEPVPGRTPGTLGSEPMDPTLGTGIGAARPPRK